MLVILLLSAPAGAQDVSPIVDEGIVEAALERVWAAWTTGEGLRAWFPFPDAIQRMWTVVYFEAAGPTRTRVRAVSLGFGTDDESQKMRGFFVKGNDTTIAQLQRHFSGK